MPKKGRQPIENETIRRNKKIYIGFTEGEREQVDAMVPDNMSIAEFIRERVFAPESASTKQVTFYIRQKKYEVSHSEAKKILKEITQQL